ncbi:BZ3500_MvSof-1268-A1-R1_C138g00742 [Microbotryum saponariae]|uniref:BZ3500_MvSof-1268-A1-R1_C047g00159 protein n=2 Tax=Microbotryum TaxID=34416 RepID=A0A2X0KI11_9BASI|nr:BZ3500_MvSof-1268-A1-R1_C061g00280 [Microbotryum saponariae]SCZ92836.1 BZ3500_MvSof-1268-A1-R1_C061g00283 [Microbotryum saponariae]SCZ93019.1 BZ3500_MvSof-1268-A1-R1_C075g00388 [Microbotryum saponariae]SCZ93023.1 BZ3500_MvSof-1268-A1-R1_C075g00391 [Microbotryum saponariae]SCZ94861.1 BZ3500_MvSof-1268-A1-R1_C049g00178 [Microbotryum saponariae]
MLAGIPASARCVQRFDDSLNSAIHITYHISLRSSSMREPRDPLLKVFFCYIISLFPYH